MVTERLEADLCSRGLLHNIKRFCVGRRLRPSSSGGDGGGAVVPLITIKQFCVDSVSSKCLRGGEAPYSLPSLSPSSFSPFTTGPPPIHYGSESG